MVKKKRILKMFSFSSLKFPRRIVGLTSPVYRKQSSRQLFQTEAIFCRGDYDFFKKIFLCRFLSSPQSRQGSQSSTLKNQAKPIMAKKRL